MRYLTGDVNKDTETEKGAERLATATATNRRLKPVNLYRLKLSVGWERHKISFDFPSSPSSYFFCPHLRHRSSLPVIFGSEGHVEETRRRRRAKL